MDAVMWMSHLWGGKEGLVWVCHSPSLSWNKISPVWFSLLVPLVVFCHVPVAEVCWQISADCCCVPIRKLGKDVSGCYCMHVRKIVMRFDLIWHAYWMFCRFLVVRLYTYVFGWLCCWTTKLADSSIGQCVCVNVCVCVCVCEMKWEKQALWRSI